VQRFSSPSPRDSFFRLFSSIFRLTKTPVARGESRLGGYAANSCYVVSRHFAVYNIARVYVKVIIQFVVLGPID
jgi:hypothetical protein